MKTSKTSRKRKNSIPSKSELPKKKLCTNESNNKNARENEVPASEINKSNHYIPSALVQLSYQIDLSVFCLLRKFLHNERFPELSLTFGDLKVNEFNNIVICNKLKSSHIRTEIVDRYYKDTSINYARLFDQSKEKVSLNDFFNSFINNEVSLSYNVEYLVIYTNSPLDITDDNKLKKEQFQNFYPFKFVNINMDDCLIFKTFLFTRNNIKENDFYKFSKDEKNREELLKRLEFPSTIQRIIKENEISQEFQNKIKEEFLDKLVFAVNQPNREELNTFIKNEINNRSIDGYNYIDLQEKVISRLKTIEKSKPTEKLLSYIKETLYELYLLMLFMHDMYLNKNILSIKYEEERYMPNSIILNCKDKIIYIKACNANCNIDYNQLFPSTNQKKKNTFSINKYFHDYCEKLTENYIDYFIIFTNVDLDITKDNTLKDNQLLKFERRSETLKDFLYINKNNLYQFSKEKTTERKLLNLLTLPSSLQENNHKFMYNTEIEVKKMFLNKIIFAVNQSNVDELYSKMKNLVEITNKTSEVLYDFEKLQEIALRWSESHELGPITENVMISIYDDILNNKSSYENKNNNEKIKFSKGVIGKDGTPAYYQFLDYLIKGNGLRYFENLKQNNINLASMSSILSGTRVKAPQAFKELYNLWFDEEGNKLQCLKTLQKQGINLSNMSSILSGSRSYAAKAFDNLYQLWFDKNGNKTSYLKTLEDNGINLANISSILCGSGNKAAEAFKNLYNLWFDKENRKTKYLTTLEENGINLTNISSSLNKVGAKASETFKCLYDLWFDKSGNKTHYLKTLEKNGINLTNMSSILHGAAAKTPIAFKRLYDLWFDKNGNRTIYLKALEDNGINLSNMSSILNGARAKAPQAFQDLYELWFDSQGNKSQYLKTLEDNEVNLTNMSTILNKVGAGAAKAFKDLYDLWFDTKGNKTIYLKSLEENGINLSNMSSILSGTGLRAHQAFKKLYNLWFDRQGNKTHYLKSLEKNGISLGNISGILCGAGSKSPQAFKNLIKFWFDKDGNKTKYLITLEKAEIDLAKISSILHRVGVSAPKLFKELYDLWFDENSNKTQYLKTLEKYEIKITNISSILSGAGVNAPKAFKELYSTFFTEAGKKKPYLKHFIKKRDEIEPFTMHNLSGILCGAGNNASKAFLQLHNICFDEKGNTTKLLNNFYEADFKPSNLSTILCRGGIHSSFILIQLHNVCFNKKGNKTKLLNDFLNAGFRPGDLCSILSGTAESLENFYDFCFIRNTKKYLNNFLNDKGNFTVRHLCKILHGAKLNICSALKDFHDVCFDKMKNRSQILNDFFNTGLTPNDLSNILSLTANNAATILKDFHKVCFSEKNYLKHFLSEKDMFFPLGLGNILFGLGTKICSIFKRLHEICFNQTGNRTLYFEDLLNANHKPNEFWRILREKTLDSMSHQYIIGTITCDTSLTVEQMMTFNFTYS